MKTLVVGGTGMLSGVVRALIAEGDEVYVLARHPQMPLEVKPLAADYRSAAALATTLTTVEPFERAVVWIHSDAPEAPQTVARFVTGPYLHVLGSASANPSRPDQSRRAGFEALGCDYREVILGFVRESGRSRWLTDTEISAGVLAALRSNERRSVIGTVTPWQDRP